MIVTTKPVMQRIRRESQLCQVATCSIPSQTERLQGVFNVTTKDVAHFSKDSALPIKGHGELLRAGYYPGYGHISKEELKRAYDKITGKKLRLFTHHAAHWEKEFQSAKNVVGWVQNFSWNDELNAIEGDTEIWDDDIALKFTQGLLDPKSEMNTFGVSLGFLYTKDYQNDRVFDMDIRECSSTFDPRCPTARVRLTV